MAPSSASGLAAQFSKPAFLYRLGGLASGDFPTGSLILSGTTLYGMTSDGGVYSSGNIFGVGIDGFGYRDLYDFTGGGDGGDPQGDLTLSGGTLFGIDRYRRQSEP